MGRTMKRKRSNSFAPLQIILVFVVIALVAGCGPRTDQERQNYDENVKELGHPKSYMNWDLIFFATVLGVGWATFCKYVRCVRSGVFGTASHVPIY